MAIASVLRRRKDGVYALLGLAPGKSVSVSTKNQYDFYGYDDVALVRVAVVRVLLEDGTDVDYDDPAWFEGN